MSKHPITAFTTAVLITAFPVAASAQVDQSLQGDARHQCTEELRWNAQSSAAPVDNSAFWYVPSLRRAVIAFQARPATRGPWRQVSAVNCQSGQSREVWTREW